MSDALNPILPLGTIVKSLGKVVAVGWIGERYYWLIDKRGTISMMPANVVETGDSGKDGK